MDWAEWFGMVPVGKRFKSRISGHRKEKKRGRQMFSTFGETQQIPRWEGRDEETTSFRHGRSPEWTPGGVKKSAYIYNQHAHNLNQSLDSSSPNKVSEPPKVPDSSETATTPDSSIDSLFSVGEVNAAVAVLNVVSNICEYGGRVSIEDRVILRDALKEIPYLLSSEGRNSKRESALMFQTKVYENPDSASWGPIESFHTLQVMLESLEKFDNRAGLVPREGRGGVFVV
ncbi:hypothetical protein IL306_011596 [Fusarium sp. DS 682]|nr:hypothetical protein IL306_011596 [Fusarium sp. DS 682]